MAPKKRNMDALDDLCGHDSDQSSDEEAEEQASKKAGAGTAAAKKLRVEDLERVGYRSGPSVMHVPEQRAQQPESTWDWSTGKDQRREPDTAPTDEVRSCRICDNL